MIRINLLPTKKRRAAFAGSADASVAQLWALGMLISWVAVGGLAFWLLTIEEDAAQAVRQEAAAVNKKVEAIKLEIDEDGQKLREEQVQQLRQAIAKLTAKRQTPVYVMYELGMILTDADEGGGPDIDLEKHRRMIKADPRNEINKRWDPTGVWITAIRQKGNTMSLEGAARDASDLSEFMRRLRASVRFGDVAHPDYQRTGKANEGGPRHLTWRLDVGVRSWR